MNRKQQSQSPQPHLTSMIPFQSNSQDKQKQKRVYIYAQVDIDRLYVEISIKSKKIRQFLQQQHLNGEEFLEKMKEYKNLVIIYYQTHYFQRITFDNAIQQFIHKKELNKELKNIKKNVWAALEDFLLDRFKKYVQQEKLQKDYKQKVQEIEEQFEKRMKELMKEYQ